MKKDLYSSDAIEKVDDNSGLSQPVRVITFPGKIAFLASIIAFIACILWPVLGVVSSASDYVAVIYSNKNAEQCVAQINGTVDDVLVKNGDNVNVGDVLAILHNDSVNNEIKNIKQKLIKCKKNSSEYNTYQKELDRLHDMTVIKCKKRGRIQMRKPLGASIKVGEPIITIIPMSTYDHNVAYVFVPKSEVGALEPGMEVQVTPSYVEREEYGYMKGIISEIDNTITTEETIIESMGTKDYYNDIAPDKESTVCVTVELMVESASKNDDDREMNNYEWSNKRGEQLLVNPGDYCNVKIIRWSKHPYEFVIK